MRAMSFTIVAFTLGIGAAVIVGGIIAEYFFCCMTVYLRVVFNPEEAGWTGESSTSTPTP